jgi:uncharacterized RDD family membrane protein YckC
MAAIAVEITPIAGLWRRLAAFVIDCLILGVPAMLAGLALLRWVASLGQAGRLIGFVVALLYFGLLDSRLGGGRTLGKRLLGIRVTDCGGNALSPIRSALRFLVIAIPYFLNRPFDVDAASAGSLWILLAGLEWLRLFVVFGGLGAIIYLFIFNRRTRQSLQDLAVGSFVVRGPPVAVPIGFSTPRLHLIITSLWLALALIAPGVGLIWLTHESSVAESTKPLVELQAAIKTHPGLRQVGVGVGKTSTQKLTLTGPSTTTYNYLLVDAQPGAWQENDLDASLPLIAGTVLDLHPDLLGNQLLIVQFSRGFDLGIANFREIRREALDAVAWRANLSSLNVRPNWGATLCLYQLLCLGLP